jgi:hypothetical protein
MEVLGRGAFGNVVINVGVEGIARVGHCCSVSDYPTAREDEQIEVLFCLG